MSALDALLLRRSEPTYRAELCPRPKDWVEP